MSLTHFLGQVRRHRRKIPYLLMGRISKATFAISNWLGRSNLYVRFIRSQRGRRFSRLFYHLRNNTFDSTFFMGKHVLKFPTDLWNYQEIIFERRPDVIVETGVFLGGSTYYFAQLLNLVGKGRVIAVDITLDHVDPDLVSLPNVTLVEGSTSSQDVFERVRKLIRPGESVMVVLDSDHVTDHVLKEMEMFSSLVTDGQYLVVEDGIIDNVYPIFCRNGPGKAIKQFLATHREFAPEYYWNRFLLTHNPSGYLLKNETVRFSRLEQCYQNLGLWVPYNRAPGSPAWLSKLHQNQPLGDDSSNRTNAR